MDEMDGCIAYITFTVTMGFLFDLHIASFEKLRS